MDDDKSISNLSRILEASTMGGTDHSKVCICCYHRNKNSSIAKKRKRKNWLRTKKMVNQIRFSKGLKQYEGVSKEVVSNELAEASGYMWTKGVPYKDLGRSILRDILITAVKEEIPITKTDSDKPVLIGKLMDDILGKLDLETPINAPISGSKLCEQHVCPKCNLRSKSSRKGMCRKCRKVENNVDEVSWLFEKSF